MYIGLNGHHRETKATTVSTGSRVSHAMNYVVLLCGGWSVAILSDTTDTIPLCMYLLW